MQIKAAPYIVLASLLLMSLVFAGCGAKDLVTLAGLEGADLYVGDRFGNKVKIDVADEFLKAFKEAKFVKDPKDAKSETEADYVFYSGDKKIYYDSEGKYLIFIEDGKKSVYSADLDGLLSGIKDLPPSVSLGFDDEELSEWLNDLSQVKEPAALLFERDGKTILVVLAGEKPSGGYTIDLNNVSVRDSGLLVSVKLVPPQEGALQVITYPYAGFTLSKETDVAVEMIVPGKTGDETLQIPVSHVADGQNVILLKPAEGSILTERVRMVGFARVPEGTFTVEVEDGHNVLGIEQVTASKGAPDWGYFDFWMDLEPATSPYGTIICVTQSPQDGSRVEELLVSVGFGAK
ncbi:MAG TPA: Gmad2 immunoglobulin-like domain-containing protein [Bacillota bacterium]|nr:Gmad2 immunoglobulin-like domain-containing protein [Bacillota bacterium]